MDIFDMDIQWIEMFHAIYIMAQDVFQTEPVKAAPNQQRKIRKWIENVEIPDEDPPSEVIQYICERLSDTEFIAFFKACYDHIQKIHTVKKQLFDASSGGLSKETQQLIGEFIHQEMFYGTIETDGTNTRIHMEHAIAYDRTLILKNSSGTPDKIEELSFAHGAFFRQGNQYCLTGEAKNYDDDFFTPFSICFTEADINIMIYRADIQRFNETPWTHLIGVASAILEKCVLPEGSFNRREKQILPLLADICRLSFQSPIPEAFQTDDLSQLKAYIKQYHFDEILPLIDDLEQAYATGTKKTKLADKLILKLNDKKYEPLWRALYGVLCDSQSTYPARAHMSQNAALFRKIRGDIQQLMHTHGYSGTYPDFVKRQKMRGLHVVESYETPYFVGMGANAAFHIHCTEEYFADDFSIEFLCGVELLRKKESAGDIASCLFQAKDRAFFHTVRFATDCHNGEQTTVPDNLRLCVQAAVKKAELCRPTKKERQACADEKSSYWLIFLCILLVEGSLFGLGMTLAFILLGIAAACIVGQPQMIPTLLSETPWWFLGLVSGGLFSIAMGLITVLAKEKITAKAQRKSGR